MYTAHAAMQMAALPFNIASQITGHMFGNSFARATVPGAREIEAVSALFERVSRDYRKPEFKNAASVLDLPFCNLLHLEQDDYAGKPKVLLVAPLSGHYATLVDPTARGLMRYADVYVTDWKCAGQVPTTQGDFSLDTYIIYLKTMLRHLQGPHVVAVCQPAVPVMAATALMEAANDPHAPRSLTLFGGPIDTRINPTAVNQLATGRGTDWFRKNVITRVPITKPGFLREVYPGFLQLGGFMAMNFERHVNSHIDLYRAVVRGDRAGIVGHDKFYDPYKAVMDLPAPYYLGTVDTVFVKHALPKGEMIHIDENGGKHPVIPQLIRRPGISTIEGEKDDITGIGQTQAAHRLTPLVPAAKHSHYMQSGAGHYGIFSGSKWEKEILPRVAHDIQRHDIVRARKRRPALAH